MKWFQSSSFFEAHWKCVLDVLRKNYNYFSFHSKSSLFVVHDWFDARIFIFQRHRLRVLFGQGSEIWVSHESAPMHSLRKIPDSTKSESKDQAQVLSSRTREPSWGPIIFHTEFPVHIVKVLTNSKNKHYCKTT